VRLVSWNVNGIRACLSKGLEDSAKDLSADFLCLQETKASPDQVELPSSLAKHSSAWASAQKKGYSGVAIFTGDKKTELANQMRIEKYDAEGRVTLAFAKGFTLVNLYLPNGAASEERHWFKMGFLDDFIPWLKKLEKECGPLVICGDYNIAHTEIDIHDPVSNKDSSGFKPEERAWMTKLLEAGFIDTFRHVHGPKKDQYSWWSYRMNSRARNKGWRLDYFCVSNSLESKIRAAEIHPNIHGSDHCPISLELSL
jgi:exodeoxyribonuclease-3